MDLSSRQQHRIMRQVLEVRGCARADAPRLQSELREVYFRRLLPLIEKTCSELAGAGEIHRIDSLEVDLGEVQADDFESAIVERFEAKFSRGLAATIGTRPGPSAARRSELELFSFYLRTGAVPWWANVADRALLEANLEHLIQHAPQVLRPAIRAIPDPERVHRRLALAYSNRSLAGLIAILMPSVFAARPGLGAGWARLVETACDAMSWSRLVARNIWWEETLRAAGRSDAATVDVPHFFRAILVRLARRMRIDLPLFITALRRLSDDETLSQPVAAVISDCLAARQPGESAGMMATGESDPEEPMPRLSSERSERFDARAGARVRQPPAVAPDRERATALIQREATDGRETPPSWFGGQGEDIADSAIVDGLDASPQRHAREAVEPLFRSPDEIYVENAGLVILWPFLERFFARLDLIEVRLFKDVAALQRSVGLLQYLAAEEAAAPEYLLPLNKVLCGMAPDDVFDFGSPITAVEIETCEDLLTAAVHQAPILHDMSRGGFRSAFLLRKGQLSVRDGTWLLRVERQTHDVVLDRFPWSVRVVKLPWMAAVMQVEW